MDYLKNLFLFCLISFKIFLANCDAEELPIKRVVPELPEEYIQPYIVPWTPDEDLNTAQLIKRYGYPSESHTIETDDGYLLTMYRIPGDKSGKRGGQPVFLQHGLLSSSADWVDEGNQSLAFMLADVGYDVWIGNARGNIYSKGHVSLNIRSPQYWNFSWHEMGVYDLPAAFNYVNKITQKPGEILYVGHSMGTTMFYVYASLMNKEAAKNVKLMVSLAPVAYMTHVRSPIRYFAPFVDDLEFIAAHLGINEFLPSNRILKFLAYDCDSIRIDPRICQNLIFVLLGFDKEEFNIDILNVVINHAPAGASTKTALHYVQEIKNSGDFRHYDYGTKGNRVEYGSRTPPSYDVSRIKVPLYFMYAENDMLASPIDVEKLARKVKTTVGLYKVPRKQFDHVSFLFGKYAPEVVYKPIINLFQNYTMLRDNKSL